MSMQPPAPGHHSPGMHPPQGEPPAAPAFGSPAPGFPQSSLPLSQVHPDQFPPGGYVPQPDAMETFHEHLGNLTPHVYVTWILLAINVAVFVWMLVSGVHAIEPKIDDLVRFGADFGPKTLAGEWWRMLTCAFVHIGIMHIAMNMVFLAIVGPMVERMFGNAGFAVLYLVSALGGSVASLWWNPMLVSAGASGAIFGMYGALLGFLARQHESVPSATLDQLRYGGLVFIGYNLFSGFFQPNVDNAAHIGGLVTGLLCGLALSQPLTFEAVGGRWLRNLATAVVGLLLIVGGAYGVQSLYADVPAAYEALEKFEAVQPVSINAMTAADTKFYRQEIDALAFADAIDKEVLPPWHEVREQMASAKRIPKAFKEDIARLVNFLQLREDAWKLRAEALRENNPLKAKQWQEKLAESDAAVAAINAEAERKQKPD